MFLVCQSLWEVWRLDPHPTSVFVQDDWYLYFTATPTAAMLMLDSICGICDVISDRKYDRNKWDMV